LKDHAPVFRDRLIETLEEMDIPVVDFGNRCNIDWSVLYKHLRGVHRTPRAITLRRLARGSGKTVEWWSGK